MGIMIEYVSDVTILAPRKFDELYLVKKQSGLINLLKSNVFHAVESAYFSAAYGEKGLVKTQLRSNPSQHFI